MNLLIIGYCSLADGFLYGSKALQKHGYIIHFFPYYNYILDNIENRDNILINFIIDNKIDICLWWNNHIKSESIINIVYNKNLLKIKNYFFNWDAILYNYEKYDENVKEYWSKIVDNKKKIYKIMDHVFSCFEKEIHYFNNYINISYCPPGFDKDISYYFYDKDYECDVSIVCTNLYNDEKIFPNDSTNINRTIIVNKLYENRDKIKFHFYGPESFKKIYPECYKGFIKYDDCYKVFSNSKINLSINPLSKELNIENSTKEYFSERVPQILGCKGLLMTNTLYNSNLINNIHYIYVNELSFYDKIINILNNNTSYNEIRENGYLIGLKYYQWDNWANIIKKNCHNVF
jgi:hypothetical protein